MKYLWIDAMIARLAGIEHPDVYNECVRITILNGLGALGKTVSRFTTVLAKFLQISLAFVRTVLQTMTPLPAKQANLEKKNLLIYFSRKPKENTSNGAISYETNRQKKIRNTTN